MRKLVRLPPTLRSDRRAELSGAPDALVPETTMDLDEDKIDDAVLALLSLTLHDGHRAWKGFDWDALDRLHRKGLIDNPVGKTKSVFLTEEGLRRSGELAARLFGKG